MGKRPEGRSEKSRKKRGSTVIRLHRNPRPFVFSFGKRTSFGKKIAGRMIKRGSGERGNHIAGAVTSKG